MYNRRRRFGLTVLALGCLASLWVAAEAYGVGVRFGHYAPDNHPVGETAQVFVEQCSRLSGGELHIQMFSNRSLGNIQSMLAQVMEGQLDMTLAPIMYLRSIAPKMDVLEMPFMFRNYGDVDRILYTENEIGRELLDELEKGGLKGITFWEIGFRHISTSRRPIRRLYDMQGLRIRITPNESLEYAFRQLGARPIAAPYSELFTMLAKGVVDAQEGTIDNFIRYKLYETQRYFSLTRHAYTALVLVMSQRSYHRLSPKNREVIFQAARTASIHGRDRARAQEERLTRSLEKYDVHLEEHPDREAFRRLVFYEVTEKFVRGDGLWLLKRIERELP